MNVGNHSVASSDKVCTKSRMCTGKMTDCSEQILFQSNVRMKLALKICENKRRDAGFVEYRTHAAES